MESKKPRASTKKGAANKKKSAIKTGTDRTKIPITEKAHKAKEQGSSAEKSKKATSKSPVKKSPAKPKTSVTSRKSAAQKKPQNTSVAELNGVSDIRRSFHKNEEPLYFISATNFNLLGADEWIKGFKFITYIECFDGLHPNVFSPKQEIPHDDFEGIEDINNYLLQHPEVQDYLKTRSLDGRVGKAMFLMFNEKTEELAKLSLIHI